MRGSRLAPWLFHNLLADTHDACARALSLMVVHESVQEFIDDLPQCHCVKLGAQAYARETDEGHRETSFLCGLVGYPSFASTKDGETCSRVHSNSRHHYETSPKKHTMTASEVLLRMGLGDAPVCQVRCFLSCSFSVPLGGTCGEPDPLLSSSSAASMGRALVMRMLTSVFLWHQERKQAT